MFSFTRHHHAHALLIGAAFFIPLLTLELNAYAQISLTPSEHHQIFRYVVYNIEIVVVKQFVIIIL